MSAQKVTDKILEDAKKDAQEILAKYKKEASSIADDFSDRAAKKKQQIEKEINARGEIEIMHAVSQQRLAINMKQTAHRRELIQKIIDEVVSKLPEHSDYPTFLKNMIKNSSENEGELLLSSTDIKRHRDELEKYMKKEGLNLKISTGEGMKGGIIIRKGKTDYIGSLDIIIELLSDELAIVVSKELFQTQSKGKKA
jgi:V/A-type H+-transporting ATPase subunit E